MNEREYIVSLSKGIDYDQFWAEMENPTTGLSFVPERRVEIVNNRDASLRSCHYSLTDQEADILRSDPRIFSVEIPPSQRTDITPIFMASQSSNFTKTGTADSGDNVNFALLRSSKTTNIYGSDTTATGTYDYILDGTGVDVVIQDGGIEANHPEFRDANGISRVQLINWYTASGISGTQSVNHYRDYDGHGTHVAGIVAGKTYGWAKNARIYSVKVNGLEGSGDSGTGISTTDCFDVIKLWHRNKPVDPVTGKKRPTIVNMSWGYITSMTNITGGNYRGTPWTDTTRQTAYGMIGSFNGASYIHGVRIGSVDSDMTELIDEGVIVCIAAGNYFQKIDISGGLDYDNFWTSSLYGNYYYHRGSSPAEPRAITVGNIDAVVRTVAPLIEQKNVSSESGPGVDIFAPGSDIRSATSNVNAFTSSTYYLDAGYKQMSISGTSMASPQVAGVGALFLQVYPTATPVQFQEWVTANAVQNLIYSTSSSTDYTDNRSIKGAANRFLFNPWAVPSNGNVTGALTLTNVSLKNI
jgi:subtilisin family serine protease